MEVVLYLRYSSAAQTEQSIEGQDRVCTEFCKQQGYEIVGRYIDRALSASKDTEKRVQFQKMIRDAEKGRFHGVVVYKLDRFARNRYDSATYKARLKKFGVRVISATENITDNPEGVLLESVLEGMAEFYSKELAQKVTRGMHESALKCNVCGGTTPLGYKVEGKKYVIDEPAAAIVREAYQLYAEGKPQHEIIRIFREKGYRTAQGAEFNKNSFYTMLRNERYTGVFIHGNVRIEGGMPQIIDRDLWEIVSKKMAVNKKAPGKGKGGADYPLTQKLFCGHCGSLMVGESGRSATGTVYRYYICTGRKRGQTCHKKLLRKDWIEKVVAEDVASALTPEMIDKIADLAVQACEEELLHNTEIPSLRAEIRDLESRINKLVKFIERAPDMDEVYERLKALKDEKKAAEIRLKTAEADVVIIEKEHVVFWLNRFLDGNIDDETFRRHIIDLLVNSVTVWDEPDKNYRIEYVINLSSHQNPTIRSLDARCTDAPQQDNPNSQPFGFLVFPSYTVFTLQRTHPAP